MRDPSAQGPPRIGRKTGRKPAFTAGDVVDAAVAEGVDRFTLSAIAERLGVVTPAIYRIFPSREEIVIACLDRAGASLVLPQEGAPWQETLTLWADECWRVCEEYPGLSRLIYSYPAAPSRIGHVFTAYVESLADQGITQGQAMFALDLISDTVFASHHGMESMRSVQEDGRTGLETVRDAIGEDDGPYQPEDWWAGRRPVETKVEFILTGLEGYWPEV